MAGRIMLNIIIIKIIIENLIRGSWESQRASAGGYKWFGIFVEFQLLSVLASSRG